MAKWRISKGRSHKWPFALHIPGVKSRTQYLSTETFYATKPVTLVLRAKNVKQAIEADGVSDSQLCSGAFCVRDPEQKLQFKGVIPDSVLNSPDFGVMVDFLESRVHITFKNSNQSGMPIADLEWAHDGLIPHLNDTTIAGQKALLAELTKDGDYYIHLRPIEARHGQTGSGAIGGNSHKNPKSGPRSHGAKRRVARIKLSSKANIED